MGRRRGMIIALICACGLSAAAGSGATLLLAERGPAGPQGEQGLEGPPGDSAFDAASDADEALDRIDDLERAVSDLEFDLESEISSALSSTASASEAIRLEGEIADAHGEIMLLDRNLSELCRALGVTC